ncbi:MAG: hypothetical protein JSU65_13205 [Candidatus Zixiibacteriota bacterium]|nr:MAG: hypothetical protein JSU65_13205 [candidate division Zixibacteria bacterium]
MQSPELLLICVTAFIAVTALLSVLAGIMRLILYVFPAKEHAADAAMIAAVASAAQNMYPGMQITKVEEIR